MCSVTQLCLTLCDATDCSMPVSSVHGIIPARILEWVAISSFIIRIYVGYYFVWPSPKRGTITFFILMQDRCFIF